MKITREKATRTSELSEEEGEDLIAAIDELENVDSYELSESDVASDNLASELTEIFLAHRKSELAKQTPSLFQVVKTLRKDYGTGEEGDSLYDAEDAAYELKRRLEDEYREDREEDISEEVAEWAAELAKALKKFIDTESWTQSQTKTAEGD